jgi:hypothetical protein
LGLLNKAGEFFTPNHFKQIGGHAVLGGAIAEVQGDDFGSGALAAGLSAFFAPAINMIGGGSRDFEIARVAASAVVGGTAAQLGGGKFANGAVTAAFMRLYNEERTLNGRIEAQKGTFAVVQLMKTENGMDSSPVRVFAEGGTLVWFVDGKPVAMYQVRAGGYTTREELEGGSSALPSRSYKGIAGVAGEFEPPYKISQSGGAFYRDGISFKVDLQSRAYLIHPTPGFTAGCVGVLGTAEQVSELKSLFSNYFQNHSSINVYVIRQGPFYAPPARF